MSTPIVITGFGCTTALASQAMATWQAIKDGRSGVRPISQWDTSDWDYPMAAELADYQPRQMVEDRKILKLISRHDTIGLGAVKQALQHSELLTARQQLEDAREFNDRTGVFVGSPGNKFNQQYDFMSLLSKAQGDMAQFAKYLFDEVHPMWLLRILPNNVLAYTAMQYELRGSNHNVTNHGVSGLQAILLAQYYLQAGHIDRAVVVGYDVAFEPQGMFYYGNSGLLSSQAIKSFDQQRDGTVLGEGAGALVLETKQAALQRQATIYGEILAGSSTCEAQGVLSLSDEANELVRCLQQTLDQAQVGQRDVGMVTAHGNGNKKSDATEAAALTQLFSSQALPVTAFKWALGHTLAASGVIDTIMTLLALREQVVPGIATLTTPAKDCAGLAVSAETQTPQSSLGLVISRGFGSLNASLLMKAVT
ncbi:MAG: 3-oxoacyl-ACP synthase [Legionellales bacterium]|nr:3-oxoacyl-ACP synthase [Legionellales bacterium]